MGAAKNEAGAHPAMSYTRQQGWEFQRALVRRPGADSPYLPFRAILALILGKGKYGFYGQVWSI